MILGDYHTHTTYSHGKGTIDDNCRAAQAKGLLEIAITDHGFNHMSYNVARKVWPIVKRDIQEARQKYPDLRIYLGLETNLMSNDGAIDVLQQDFDSLDMLVCGYHKFVKAHSWGSFWNFNLPVLLGGATHLSTKKRIVKTTDAFIKAMDKYPISIISHPGLRVGVDLYQLAKAAAHYKVYLELNGKGVAFSLPDTEKMLETDCEFIINSDAHSALRVGDFEKPIKFVGVANIPVSRIANWQRTPVFRKF